MASLLNPFGFGQKHAYFYVRLTIHELKNVPLISGEFQVKWRFKHAHPVADVPGLSPAASTSSSAGGLGGGGLGSAAASSTNLRALGSHDVKAASAASAAATTAASSSKQSRKAAAAAATHSSSASSSAPPSGPQSQVASVNASSTDLTTALAGPSTSSTNLTTADSASVSTSSSSQQPSQGQQQSHSSSSAGGGRTHWHHAMPEPRGQTELLEVSDHTVRWQRRVEVGLKMGVERVQHSNASGSNHHHHHKGRESSGIDRSSGGGLGVGTSAVGSSTSSATVTGSSAASVRSLGSASHHNHHHRDRSGDDARSIKGSVSGTALDSYASHHERREETVPVHNWGKLAKSEVKLIVKQQIDTSSQGSHTMAPPVLGNVVLNLAEFAPHSHPAQANHYHSHHHHHHHHHHLHHHGHLHHHHDIDPKQALFRSETRRFLLNESRTNASLTITVEMVHIGGTREYIVPTLRDGIIIYSSDQTSSDFPLLPFLHPPSARDDLSPGASGGPLQLREAKDRKENENLIAPRGGSGDSSVDTPSGTQYAASIGGQPYRERASSSVSSFDARSARSFNASIGAGGGGGGGTAEYAAFGGPSRATKALSAGLSSRSSSNYPYVYSAPRSVAGHTRIPSTNLRDPEAVKEHKAKERNAADKRRGLGIGEGTELSPEEIVRDLFRAEPKHLRLKGKEDAEGQSNSLEGRSKLPPPSSASSSSRDVVRPSTEDSREHGKDDIEYLQPESRPRSGKSSGRSSIDGRSLGADLRAVLLRRPSSSSGSSKSTDALSAELASTQLGGPKDDATGVERRSLGSAEAGLNQSSGEARAQGKGSDSSVGLADVTASSEPPGGGSSARRGSISSSKGEKAGGKGHGRTSSATSSSSTTMRSILSPKGLANVLTKRHASGTGSGGIPSASSKEKDKDRKKKTSAMQPAAVITRLSGPERTPGLLNPASPSETSFLQGRPPNARGPSIRWDLGGVGVVDGASGAVTASSPISTTSFETAASSISGPSRTLDVIPASSRVVPPSQALAEGAVDDQESKKVEGSMADGAPPPASPSAASQPAIVIQPTSRSASASTSTSSSSNTKSPSMKSTKSSRSATSETTPDKSRWRGAGWRADLDLPQLADGVYTRPVWPPSSSTSASLSASVAATATPTTSSPTQGRGGLSLPQLLPKIRAGSMNIYRLNPKVSSPPEDGSSAAVALTVPGSTSMLGGHLAAEPLDLDELVGASTAPMGTKTGAIAPAVTSTTESVFLSTPAGVADQLNAGINVALQSTSASPQGTTRSPVPSGRLSPKFYVDSVPSSSDEGKGFGDGHDDEDEEDEDEDEQEGKCYEDARQSVVLDRD